MLWSTTVKPQRLMPFGVATLPFIGRHSYADEQNPGRWRD